MTEEDFLTNYFQSFRMTKKEFKEMYPTLSYPRKQKLIDYDYCITTNQIVEILKEYKKHLIECQKQ
jgi:hypothetical protein